MKVVLLNGRLRDPHIKGISKELKKINQKYFVTDSFAKDDSFSVRYEDGAYSSEIEFRNSKIKNTEIKSIWNTSPLHIKTNRTLSEESKAFVRAEWTEGIHSFWNSINTKWINHPSSIIAAVNRTKQLELASKVGLQTPKTLVTNNPKKLKDFFSECKEEIIAKTLHSSEGLPENKMIFTTKITKNDLKRSSELRYAPTLFQEYVPKKTEFRITIIGDILRIAEIHSQKSEKTKHDWRQYDDFKRTPYKRAKIPKNTEESLLKLMSKMNLKFGAADLIRTPNDEYVFLEINPNGRWWWIQELTKMNIAKDIAMQLRKTN